MSVVKRKAFKKSGEFLLTLSVADDTIKTQMEGESDES